MPPLPIIARRDYDAASGIILSGGNCFGAAPMAAPGMGAYMAEEHDLRRARARADTLRREQQQAVHRKKDTADFFSEVDAEMRKIADELRRGDRQQRHVRQNALTIFPVIILFHVFFFSSPSLPFSSLSTPSTEIFDIPRSPLSSSSPSPYCSPHFSSLLLRLGFLFIFSLLF